MAKKPNSKKAPKSPRETCFVIMPFGGWLDDYYETIYRPAIKAAGLEAHRADDLFRPSTIVNDIWAYTKRARLLVADLSGKNPNVFYELGLAHALAKPAILVAESMDEIPYDLRALRVLVYDKNDPDWGKLLKEKVQASIKEVLRAPAGAVLPAFLDTKDAGPRTSVTPHEKEILELRQQVDILREEIRSPERRLLSPPGRRIDMPEARHLLLSMLDMHMRKDDIINRLGSLGVPSTWALHEINMMKRDRPLPSPKRK